MTRRLSPILITLVLTCPVMAATDNPPSPWRTDWNDAFRAAKQQHRMVFVEYFATWCEPCREMEKTVFPDPEVQRRFSDFVLLRIDVDRGMAARAHAVKIMPTYAVYDHAERERFRVVGALKLDRFIATLDAIRGTAPMFEEAAALFDGKQEVEAVFLAANTYSHAGLGAEARSGYEQARKAAEKKGDRATAQVASVLSAFTFVRDGDPAHCITLLKELAVHPVDSASEATIWLTLGNAYRATKDVAAARDAYQRAQSLSSPNSSTYKDAAEAMSSLR